MAHQEADAGIDNELLSINKETLRDLDSEAFQAENVKGGAGIIAVRPGTTVMTTGTSVIMPSTVSVIPTGQGH